MTRRPNQPPLPRILEIKRTLAGRETHFDCGMLSSEGEHLVVLFVANETMHVHGVELPAGTMTFGHFWGNRPYNVYHWLARATGMTLGVYVNLSSDTRIEDQRLEWRDLIVDVLVLPGAGPRVLDEDEIPPDAAPDLLQAIESAKAEVLGTLPRLLSELESARARWWETAVTEVARSGRPSFNA